MSSDRRGPSIPTGHAALVMFGLVAVAAVLIATRADAQDTGWDLRIPERVELVAGAGGSLPITIAVDRGRTISKDGGITIDLAPEGAVSVKRRRLARTDAVDPDADAPRFAIALRADNPGDFAIKVKIRFWLCGQKVCRPIEARRTVAISATAPAPPPPPPVDAGVPDAVPPDAGRKRR